MNSFWTSAIGAAVGVAFTTLIKTWFDHYISGATLKSAQQDDDLKAIHETIIDIRDRAIAYWRKNDSGRDTYEEAAAITGRMTFLGQVVEELFEEDSALKKAATMELNRFDECVTHGNFMVANREKETSRLKEIEDNAYCLLYRTRRCRRKLKRHIMKT
ncbi:hypothetical protein [Marinovum algicola]|uniref:hypothetical protein n=1 Tax=Marinovum algicola TaxID=42444 RepID=UPI003B51CADB